VTTDTAKARRLKFAGLTLILAGVATSVGALVSSGPAPVVPGGGFFVILGAVFLARSRRLNRPDS
jgi:xanthine/uracil permease